MYNRKQLKKNARGVIKRSYWVVVMVCFIMAMLTSAYSGSMSAANSYDSENETTEAVANKITYNDNVEVLNQLSDKLIKNAPESLQNTIGWANKFLANTFSGNSSFMSVARLINSASYSHAVFLIVFLTCGIVIMLAYNIFVQGVLTISEKRVFLETRSCEKVRIGRLFMAWRHHISLHYAWISLKKYIFLFLWSLTIIGGVIKSYEYTMVDFIAAENPALGAKDVFRLSKKMMHGNKWRLFVLDLSMLGWVLLSVCTFGLFGIFFANPYQTAVQTEFYVWRRDSLDEQDKLLLCDAQLAPYLGASEYDDNENKVFAAVVKKRPMHPVNADRKYSVTSLILLFFFFSFVGWAWEVALHLFKDGVFVNRGTMFGPWLPIYGSGGVLIIVLLRRFMKNVPLTFFMTMLVCGVVEYFTSWILETTKGIKWWDYSGHFMNINGRICLAGLLVFGMGGCAFLYFIAPRVDDVIKKIPKSTKTTICTILCMLFSIDIVYSQFHPNTGKGITDYPTKEQLAQSVMSEKQN